MEVDVVEIKDAQVKVEDISFAAVSFESGISGLLVFSLLFSLSCI